MKEVSKRWLATDTNRSRRSYSKFLCPVCGQVVVKRRSGGLKAKTCSVHCKKQQSNPERVCYYNGYARIIKPKHPKAHNYMMKRSVVVAESKLGRYLEDGEVVHHTNGIKDDDRPENLEVMGISEHHRLHSRGINNKAAKLTTEQVLEIRGKYRPGIRHCDIAKEYGVCRSTISLVLNRKHWRYL